MRNMTTLIWLFTVSFFGLAEYANAQQLEQLQRVAVHRAGGDVHAPLHRERARELTLDGARRQVHGRARHDVDEEPRLQVVQRDLARLAD